ncbi:serine hydrolase domain-containing protein [Cryptosporangium sp. NPDC051539]|uniref:serine hydrolase domain-containing protein n=1 Tax=Cryptosporangium sp. NPDC051539 TaxID=3363962 RepID=UPI00379269EA
MPKIEGHTTREFAGVRDAFTANFQNHGDIGAAVAVYQHGRPAVDLWGGVADPATGRLWERDTLQMVMSATKGIVAGCAHLLAQRRELDLDAPVATYWPEFAAAGKEKIPVRWLLTHQAGLVGTRMADLHPVIGDEQLAVLRTLVDRRRSLGQDHTRIVSPLHALPSAQQGRRQGAEGTRARHQHQPARAARHRPVRGSAAAGRGRQDHQIPVQGAVRVLHLMATVRLRNQTEGRAYYDRAKRRRKPCARSNGACPTSSTAPCSATL